jgi:glycosyltransferase involved in cell wall biosynthesis
MFGEFRRLVAELNPDLIHSHFVGTTLTMRLGLGKTHPIPRIFQVPGPLHVEHAFFRYSEIMTAGRSDYWIGTCTSICEQYRRSGISEHRMLMLDYGVNLNTYICQRKGGLRKELNLRPNTKIIGMIAFMYPPKSYLGQKRGLKGHEDLIDAMAICMQKEPDILCVFIGGGWNKALAYENRVRAYGKKKCGKRAIFMGTRHDVAGLLPDFDISVQPSHSEGVAATAVEAQLLGIPLIATNVGGQPDLVVHGETGWLVPPRDPTRLAEAILEALHDPVRARKMATKGRDRAQQLFDVKVNSRRVLEFYDTILTQCESR